MNSVQLCDFQWPYSGLRHILVISRYFQTQCNKITFEENIKFAWKCISHPPQGVKEHKKAKMYWKATHFDRIQANRQPPAHKHVNLGLNEWNNNIMFTLTPRETIWIYRRETTIKYKITSKFNQTNSNFTGKPTWNESTSNSTNTHTATNQFNFKYAWIKSESSFKCERCPFIRLHRCNHCLAYTKQQNL